MQEIKDYLSENASRFEQELIEFLKIPTISADSKYQADVIRGAEFVRKQLADIGFDAETIETEGYPIVFGSWEGVPGAPTVLVYGHYDVQPPDPLDQWISPPFEPEIREGKVYARGATDDKGQMFTHIKSVEAWLKTTGRLPVNVKFVIEGEEEVGSENLDRFLEANRKKVRSDVAVISDTSQYAPGLPAITYGLRGILAAEIRLTGPDRDLHSGMFGGSVANPANVLASLVASLHNEQGRVQIPGFYDAVVELTQEEREGFAKLPFDEAAALGKIGVEDPQGEAGFSTLERRWARPTCDVNGLVSGYTGEGPKTIVPSTATAKISCRLVPDQNPRELTESLERFLADQIPPGIRFEFIDYHGCEAIVFTTESRFMSAAKGAIEAAFGTTPVMIREGGSIPVVGTFRDVLGIDTLLLGWGQNTDNLHSPNEHFSIDDFHRGTNASAHLWQLLADGSPT